MCILYEREDSSVGTRGIDWICIRSYGGGIDLEFVDTGHGTGGIRRYCKGDSGSSGILVWHFIFAAA